MRQTADLYLDSCDYCVEDAINYINSYIDKNEEKNLCIDISKYNFIEATNICILSSTYSFAQSTNNQITWIVDSLQTKATINRLKLQNISLEVKSTPVSFFASNLAMERNF